MTGRSGDDGGGSGDGRDDERHAQLLNASAGLAGSGSVEQDLRGAGWGAVPVHTVSGSWRWPGVFADSGLTVLSVGVPVGAPAGASPGSLAQRALAGQDVHVGLVPPFGLVTVDDAAGRAVVQQDWLGMSRLFVGADDDVVVVSTRPSLVAAALGDPHGLDIEAWAGYAAAGHFPGSMAPFEGVRLMDGGQRLSLARHPDGCWAVESSRRPGVDDLVLSGLARRSAIGTQSSRVRQAAVDLAASGLTRVVGSVGGLYDGPVALGLSGGKDSRVIAAALLSAGVVPTFTTNITTEVEGTTAVELLRRLRESRRLDPQHQLSKPGEPGRVLRDPLLVRAERIRVRYDHQYPSSYLSRPAVSAQPPAALPPPSFGGAGGEILTGYWYPHAELPPQRMKAHLATKLCGAGSLQALTSSNQEAHLARALALLARASELGLEGFDVLDYAYLIEKMRRWCTLAYTVGQVAPFLAPEVVEAAFALSPADKAERVFHRAVLDVLAPEWSDIPFVSASTGGNPAARIWHGDGMATLHVLHAGPSGALTGQLASGAVASAIAAVRTGRPRAADSKILDQFVTLAVADAAHGTGPALPDTSLILAAEVPQVPLSVTLRRRRIPAPVRRLLGPVRGKLRRT
jgi:asparagine synthase (glutamine-hydrolysing)